MIYDRIISIRNDKTVFHHEDMCIKVFGSSYRQSDVYEEALNQIRARETGKLNVPKVHRVIFNEGKWAIVSEYISGSSLRDVLLKNPERFDELLEDFVNLQISIQKIRNSSLLPLYFKVGEHRKDKNLKDVNFEDKSMCHLDFNTENVMLSDDGKLYVVDWSNLVSGDRLYDSAGTYLSILYAYGEDCAKKYLDLYSQKTGCKSQDITRLEKAFATVILEKSSGHRRQFLTQILNK